MTLYHFTCKHGQKGIGRYGLILPKLSLALTGATLQPWQKALLGWFSAASKPCHVSWMTDDPALPAEALGLTSHTIKCDRMEFLYSVEDPDLCEPFLAWASRTGNPFVSRLLDERKRPEHWYVAEQAVRARQVRDYVKA